MYLLFSFLLVLAAILLIVVVLLQPGKGAGLASAGFSGITGQFGNMFGVRRTADFLQKFTIGLAIGILLVSLLVNKFFLEGGEASTGRAPVTVGASKPLPQTPNLNTAPPAAKPAQPAQQQPAQQKK